MFDTFNAVVTVPLVCTQVSAGWHSTYEDLLTKYTIIVFMFILIINQLFVVCYIIIHSGCTKEILYKLPYSIIKCNGHNYLFGPDFSKIIIEFDPWRVT